MMLMIIAALSLLGLCLGSFVNALVWRVHEQEVEVAKKRPSQKRLRELSISRGRSICPHCGHGLSARDLVPVLSWLSLRGKCRYCHKSISAQYPLVELATAGLFVLSYVCWPVELTGIQSLVFGLWLLLLTGLMALVVYDLRWLLLPNRIVYPLGVIAGLMATVSLIDSNNAARLLLDMVASVAIGGGIFYLLFQVSNGKWIGGGDVKLGWLLGLMVASPGKSLLFIFVASIIGSLISLPLLLTKRLNSHSVIPFGPLLITGAVIAYLFGAGILDWYQHTLLLAD